MDWATFTGILMVKGVHKMDNMKENKEDYTFIENPFLLSRRQFLIIFGMLTAVVMLPLVWLKTLLSKRNQYIIARSKGLYQDDIRRTIRASHKNSAVQKLYEDFAGHPLSDIAEQLFHTSYTKRSSSMREKGDMACKQKTLF